MRKSLFLSSAAALMMAGVCFAASTDAGSADPRAEKVRAALPKLDPTNDDDWTDGGLPHLGRMQSLTGLNDLKRDEVGKANPGFNRTNASSAPSDMSNVGKSDAAASAGPTETEGEQNSRPATHPTDKAVDEANSKLEEANELRQPNLDPKTNPNVGRDDLGPYEGQTHTADQGERLAEEIKADLWTEGNQPQDLADEVKDPIFLIEAAVAAMNADERYRKNGELQQFMRHYSIAQVNIKSHQERLNKRYEDLAAR